MSENGTDKETTERDYKSDLLICDGATLGPWKLKIKGNSVQSFAINRVCSGMKPRGGDAHFIALARTALPWYIKRCMELDAQLRQAEEREARYREALEYYADQNKWQMWSYHGESIFSQGTYKQPLTSVAEKALSSPSQPSRYQEALAVVEIIKKIGLHLSRHHGKECNCLYCQLYDALAALDKAGEGAGK